MSLKNTGKVPAKDLRLTFHFHGESGTTVEDKNYTATIILAPGEVRTLKGINLGFITQQAHECSTRVLSFYEPGKDTVIPTDNSH